MPAQSHPTAWWQNSLAPPPAGQAGAAAGLSTREARARLARDGANLPRAPRRWAPLLQYLARFGNPLIIILLVASAVSALMSDMVNFLIISAMVLLSVTLDFIQEYRASAAADRLRRSVSVRATVLRDGRAAVIPASELVRGDLVLLAAGDLIPADGIVIEADALCVNEALLTGESFPAEKHAGLPSAPVTALHEATHALFSGTAVVSGSARMLVRETGSATVVGALGARLATAPLPTSFEAGIARFGMLIMRLTVLMVLFVLFVNTVLHRPMLESFLFAVALAVGLTPELLPMVVSVTLARGAVRMAAQQMVVKRMTAIQDLGSMDVLCTDKTGTLTEAKMRLERHVDAQGRDSERVLDLACLNSYFQGGLKSALDDAVLAHARPASAAWTRVDEVPFDFARRRVSVLIDNGELRLLVVKGAPDQIVELCSHYEESAPSCTQEPEIGPGATSMDAAARGAVEARYHAMEDDGLRVLGIAWRALPRDQMHATATDESGLILAGFVAFLDPPKQSAAAALAELQELGVAIKVITGDSERVTRHVCRELGLAPARVVTGQEVARLDDPALRAVAGKANLFCRIDPLQKNRIILALKARGHVVGYLGDGINDAPSLQSADVGVSVDSAADVAREAADMILLAHDLRVLHAGVLEGRRTFGNIMKYILMVTSSNFGNMLSMAAASLYLPFLPMLPIQILLNNSLYDLSELAIPLDRVDPEETRRPRTLELGLVRNFMLLIGAVSSLFDLLTFYLLLAVLHADEALFQTGWFVESLCTQVLVIFVIRTRANPLKSRVQPLLAATSLAVVLSAAPLPYTALGSSFAMVPLPPLFYVLLGSMVILYLLAVELVKQRFYRWYRT